VIRLISAKERRTEWLLDFRLEAYPALADHGRAGMAERQVSKDRLPGHQLFLGAQAKKLASIDEVDPSCCAPSRNWGCR
jgi:hypothetical protein